MVNMGRALRDYCRNIGTTTRVRAQIELIEKELGIIVSGKLVEAS